MPGIAIIDSGVGGLSIYQEIKKQLPDYQYTFVSDNQAFPYGTKAEDELTKRVFEIVERVIAQFKPELVVIACNTASTVVLPRLREHFSVPIVGVVPAIKPAAQLSKTKKIGLLATPATIKRAYTDALIDEFASNCEVIRVGSSRLVEIAEDMFSGKSVSIEEIETIMTPILDVTDIDVIVLACTHFPLLNIEIEEILKSKRNPILLVDSGQGIANRVAQLTKEINTGLTTNSAAALTDLDSVEQDLLRQVAKSFHFKKIVKLEALKS